MVQEFKNFFVKQLILHYFILHIGKNVDIKKKYKNVKKIQGEKMLLCLHEFQNIAYLCSCKILKLKQDTVVIFTKSNGTATCSTKINASKVHFNAVKKVNTTLYQQKVYISTLYQQSVKSLQYYDIIILFQLDNTITLYQYQITPT